MIEADTVAHCGPTLIGEFARTLTMTDVVIGWTENCSIRNNASKSIVAGVEQLTELFPFDMVIFDSDCGSEFINHEVAAWLQARDIEQTRSRPYQKNDQAHVESKNNHVVRKHAFYWRYDTQQELELLNRLWRLVSLRLNFFTPTKKAVGYTTTTADGRKKRIYDKPATPWQRLQASDVLDAQHLSVVAARVDGINPADLTRQINAIQMQLLDWPRPRPKPSLPPVTSTWQHCKDARRDQSDSISLARGGGIAGVRVPGRVVVWPGPALCGRCVWRRPATAAGPVARSRLSRCRGSCWIWASWRGRVCRAGQAARNAGPRLRCRWRMRFGYDADVRPVMPGNPISLKALVRVAEARASYADHATGRDSRPTNARLACDTRLSVRTVQRADTALRLMGVATEVLRGRQRTRTERMASWRMGDRGRGWTSVWALHDDAQLARFVAALSPHPEGSPFKDKSSVERGVTTDGRRPAGVGERSTPRRASPDPGGARLAAAWRADPHAPPWARR